MRGSDTYIEREGEIDRERERERDEKAEVFCKSEIWRGGERR